MSRQIYFPTARANIALVPTTADLLNLDPGDVLRQSAIKPSKIEVTHNNAHEADEWTMEMPVAHFNVDPRIISTLSTEIFIGDAGGLDNPLDTSDSRRASVLGTMDEFSKEYSATGRELATLNGRDYTAFLLDNEWNGYVDLEGTLSDVIREVLDTFAATKRMRVTSLLDQPSTFTAGRSKMQRRFAPKSGATLWEGLRDIARRFGLIVTVRGDQVVIRPPQDTSLDSHLPVFVAGRNLQSLSVSKKYGAEYAPNVIVRSRDPDTWDIVEGKYPRTDQQIARVVARQGKTPENVTSIDFKNFEINHPDPTPPKLDTIARQVHERFVQQQLEVSFETREMLTWELPQNAVGPQVIDGFEETFDLTTLRNGDAIRIVIDPASRDILERATSKEQKRRQLQREGFDAQVADELAKKWQTINAPFYVDRATHTVDSGSYQLSVDAINKIKAG